MTPHPNILARTTIAVALALVLLLALPALAAADDSANGFSVTPLRVDDLTIQPGHSKKISVTILNTLDNKETFTFDTEDIEGSKSDPSKNPVLLGEQVDSPISAADWLHPSRSSIELSPNESHTIQVEVAVPSGSSGGHYAALTVTSEARSVNGGTVRAQSRVAVLFFINAGKVPPPEIVIQDVTTTSGGDTIIDYIDDGTKAATHTTATIEYVDPVTGKVVATRSSDECGDALPGGVAECVIKNSDLQSVTDGSSGLGRSPFLRGRVKLTSDGRTVKAEQPVQWAGSWTSLLLPLAGLGILFFWFWRRRREEEEDDALVTP